MADPAQPVSSDEGLKLREFVGRHRHPGRHHVPAALEATPESTAARTALPRSTPDDRPAGAGCSPVGVEGEGESRAAKALLGAGGDQPDDAGMPLGRGGHEDRQVGRCFECELRLGLGFGHGLDLDGLALAIETIELARKLGGLDRIFGEQKPRAEGGIADAAARIDARPDEKSEMPAFRRPGETRDIEKSRQTGTAATAHDDEPLPHESPVKAHQRHHVSDSRQRHQVDASQQVGLRPVPKESRVRAGCD